MFFGRLINTCTIELNYDLVKEYTLKLNLEFGFVMVRNTVTSSTVRNQNINKKE